MVINVNFVTLQQVLKIVWLSIASQFIWEENIHDKIVLSNLQKKSLALHHMSVHINIKYPCKQCDYQAAEEKQIWPGTINQYI